MPSLLISTQIPTAICYRLYRILATWVREVKKGKHTQKPPERLQLYLVKGANSTHMTKGKLADRAPRTQSSASRGDGSYHTHRNHRRRQGKVFLDATRLAARERLKADQERQARNEEWRRLHELGSPAEYDHSLNRATQLVSEDKTTDNDNELLTLEWSEDTKNKMQTEALDEKEKWKAWGSLCTPTGNKGSFTASPKKKKARQVNVDLIEAVVTMVIDVDLEKDIDATQQPVSTSTVEVPGIIAINEDEEDKDEEAGEEEVTRLY